MGADLHHPHHQAKTRHAVCAIVTVSDTRTPESDASGVCIRALLEEARHRVLSYTILPDDPGGLRAHLEELFGVPGLDAVIVNGGTGLAATRVRFAVNETYVEPSHRLADGDEVAFFPPVSGGG